MTVSVSIGFLVDPWCIFDIAGGFENWIILSSEIITLNASSTLFEHFADVSIYWIFNESANSFEKNS